MRSVALLFLVFLYGCVAIPLPTTEAEPFDENILERISEGKVSKNGVINALGTPDVQRKDGQLWIYGEFRRLTHLFIISIIGGSIEPISDWQFVVVEFDDDIVTNVELVEAARGCSSSGVCLRYGWRPERGDLRTLYTEDRVVIASNGADDSAAKLFNTLPDKCSIYVYADATFHVAVGDFSNILMTSSTYTYFSLTPGPVSIITFRHPRVRSSETIEKQVECRENEIVIVHLPAATKWFSNELKVTIEEVDFDEGSQSIKDRNLIVF